MNSIKITQPIVLIGMMGAGKTHIGSQLSYRLGIGFVDSDKIIEEKAGCSISEIFERDGEAKFRSVESTTIIDQLNHAPHIIATGGGAVTNASTMSAIKEKAISFWLRADIDTLFERVSKNASRPLLQTTNPRETLQKLLEARESIYASADYVIDNPLKRTGSALDDIIGILNNKV